MRWPKLKKNKFIINICAKGCNNGCLAGTFLSHNNDMENPQRLSYWVGVKPQANGGRKMLPYNNMIIGEDIVYAYVKAWEVCFNNKTALMLRINVNEINIYKFKITIYCIYLSLRQYVCCLLSYFLLLSLVFYTIMVLCKKLLPLWQRLWQNNGNIRFRISFLCC